MNAKPPQFDRVVADCDEALKLDAKYLKALNRRATALESLKQYEESLRGVPYRLETPSPAYQASCTDFTACTILERFSNEQTSASVERVLKLLATEKATEILKASPTPTAPPARSHAPRRHGSPACRRTPSSPRTLEPSAAVRLPCAQL